MKQETGSKQQPSAQKVSIQLALDGHSFSTEELSKICADKSSNATIELLTSRTALVPTELFASTDAVALLATCGIILQEQECAVASQSGEGMVAVMAAPAATAEAIAQLCGPHASFTSPLLKAVEALTPTVWLYPANGLLYIKIYDGTLRLAEVISAPSEVDIVYLCERLSSEFALKRFELRLTGGSGRSLKKVLGSCFRRTICE